MKLHHATALAAILCSLTGAAHAGNFAFGTSNLGFHVVDLTPDDGAAAGFAVTDTWSDLNAGLTRPEGYRSYETEVLGLRDFTAGATIRGAHAGVGVSSVLGDTTLTYSEPVSAYTFAWVRGLQEITLTVKANSQLVIDGNTFTQLSGWNPAYEFEGRVSLTLRPGPSGTWTDPVSELVRPVDYASGTDAVQSFQLTYANSTAQDATIRLQIRDYLYYSADRAALAPVPEPATYALLGAGLLVVGAAARRRRAGQPA